MTNPNSKARISLFISYSHDSEEHKGQVLHLAQRLRAEGIDADLDQFHFAPASGWPIWMQQSIENTQFVLVVCTPNYKRRFEGREEEGKGLGATWEGFLTTSYVYSQGAKNEKFIPILFPGSSTADIPAILSSTTRYELPRDYEKLYRRLTNQPEVVAQPVGELRKLDPLPPKEPVSAGAIQPPFEPQAATPLQQQVANKKFETLSALIEEAEPFLRRLFNTPPRDPSRTHFLNRVTEKLHAASPYMDKQTVEEVWKYITEVGMAKAELDTATLPNSQLDSNTAAIKMAAATQRAQKAYDAFMDLIRKELGVGTPTTTSNTKDNVAKRVAAIPNGTEVRLVYQRLDRSDVVDNFRIEVLGVDPIANTLSFREKVRPNSPPDVIPLGDIEELWQSAGHYYLRISGYMDYTPLAPYRYKSRPASIR